MTDFFGLPTVHKPYTVEFISKTIYHRRYNRGLMKINIAHRSHSGEAGGLFVIADPGNGKTRLAQGYANQVNPPPSDTRNLMHVLIFDAPESASVEAFYESALAKMGDPKPYQGRLGAKKVRFRLYVRELQVQLIIVDEAHNLMSHSSKMSATEGVANAIKSIMNTYKISVVLMGERKTLELRKHDAISSRFLTTHFVEPLSLGSQEDLKYFQEYLNELQKYFPFRSVNFGSEEFALRMHYATNGNLREIRKIMAYVLDSAVESKPIALEDFSDAWKIQAENNHVLAFDPFRASFATIKSEFDNDAQKTKIKCNRKRKL